MNRDSEAYKLAEKIAAEFRTNGKKAAEKMYLSLVDENKQIKYWEKLAIGDRVRELVSGPSDLNDKPPSA